MRRVALLAAVGLLAGCGAGKGPAVPASALPRLVLQPADVPGLAVFDSGRITKFDIPSGPRADPSRFGRVDGWKTDYKRSGGTSIRGPAVVHSEANLFATAQGARKDLDAYRSEFEANRASFRARVHDLSASIGDSSAGIEQVEPGTPSVLVYLLAWVDGRVSASITVTGFAGRLALADVLRLARAQERRIAAAQR